MESTDGGIIAFGAYGKGHVSYSSGGATVITILSNGHNALTRWQKKGYLKKIRSGFYRLTNRPIKGEADLFFIANRIYTPSYISLQPALRWYNFIPEGVFTIYPQGFEKAGFSSRNAQCIPWRLPLLHSLSGNTF